MAVLHVYEAKGDSTALMRKYASLTPKFREPKHTAGLLAHFVVETGDGIAVYNLMDNPDHMKTLLNDDALSQAVEKAGLSSVEVPHTFHTYKVHDYHLKK